MNTQRVRAKFVCQNITASKYAGGATTKIVLTAATAYNSDEADSKPFWDSTPSGTIELQTVNQRAVALFQPGVAYYIDFTEAHPII